MTADHLFRTGLGGVGSAARTAGAAMTRRQPTSAPGTYGCQRLRRVWSTPISCGECATRRHGSGGHEFPRDRTDASLGAEDPGGRAPIPSIRSGDGDGPVPVGEQTERQERSPELTPVAGGEAPPAAALEVHPEQPRHLQEPLGVPLPMDVSLDE